RGASDTEFKYRIFPFATFAHIPETLGVFMNYPERRVTEHPRAELEDLLAMHLYKTVGGLRYLLRGKNEEEVVALLGQSISFRRSYSQSTDTDLELAVGVANHLRAMNPTSSQYSQWASEIGGICDFLRALEASDGSVRSLLSLRRQAAGLQRLQNKHSRQLGVPVYYHLLNDVRFAVHANVWNIKEQTF
ncbi:MAG: hypothetical protein FWC56_06125, partial [Phycisphaerae bacterium]|nr:hypothetical protein [Phycisphaerae bacterium]